MVWREQENRKRKAAAKSCQSLYTCRGVGWPFWQVRTQVHMVFKTSYKITFLLSLIHNCQFTGLFTIKRDIKKKLLKRSSLSWYRNISQHKARRLFCKNLSLEKKYYIGSLGVNFSQNSCWYSVKRAPAYVDYRRHGLVHDFPVERHQSSLW